MSSFASLIWTQSDVAVFSAGSRVFMLTLMAVVGIWLFVRYLRIQTARMSDAWRALAADLDFSYRPSRGPAFRRRSEEIEGVVDGIPVRLTRYGLSPGLDSAVYTRWSAELDPPPQMVLYVHGKHGLSTLARMLGYDDLAVGDAEFDRLWSTKSDAPEQVQKILTPEVRAAIRKLRSACVVVNETGVNVVWSGQVVAPIELKNGLSALTALLHTLHPAEAESKGSEASKSDAPAGASNQARDAGESASGAAGQSPDQPQGKPRDNGAASADGGV